MSSREEKEIKLALNAELDTGASKVRLFILSSSALHLLQHPTFLPPVNVLTHLVHFAGSPRVEGDEERGESSGGNYGGDDPDLPRMDEGRQSLSREVLIPSNRINPSTKFSQNAYWWFRFFVALTDELISMSTMIMRFEVDIVITTYIIIYYVAQLMVESCRIGISEYVTGHYKREETRVLPPRPIKLAAVSTLGFCFGGSISPLAGSFIPIEKVRIGVVVGFTSIALILSTIGGARMGRLPIRGSILRIFFSGLFTMCITYGVICRITLQIQINFIHNKSHMECKIHLS
ncbi:hypothetical protein NE237_022057 [Protea cynaroides]|uniref:Vacuolar iron transporter n=1 Tax=Protea cynaroides TaxID=273540 RepID=A0A9Q0GKB1_9MAGN|nr:hypothetical protein NE237_022057 [Protea cynaroides]